MGLAGGRGGLETRLRAEGLDPGGWGNGPGDRYAAHRHAYDKVIVVTEGSIAFGFTESAATSDRVSLEAGDRLELPAGTDHEALIARPGFAALKRTWSLVRSVAFAVDPPGSGKAGHSDLGRRP